MWRSRSQGSVSTKEKSEIIKFHPSIRSCDEFGSFGNWFPAFRCRRWRGGFDLHCELVIGECLCEIKVFNHMQTKQRILFLISTLNLFLSLSSHSKAKISFFDHRSKMLAVFFLFSLLGVIANKTEKTESSKREFFHRVIRRWPRISFTATASDVRRLLSMETQATSTEWWRCNEKLNEKWEWKPSPWPTENFFLLISFLITKKLVFGAELADCSLDWVQIVLPTSST